MDVAKSAETGPADGMNFNGYTTQLVQKMPSGGIHDP
jgi:hypothetical protein